MLFSSILHNLIQFVPSIGFHGATSCSLVSELAGTGLARAGMGTGRAPSWSQPCGLRPLWSRSCRPSRPRPLTPRETPGGDGSGPVGLGGLCPRCGPGLSPRAACWTQVFLNDACRRAGDGGRRCGASQGRQPAAGPPLAGTAPCLPPPPPHPSVLSGVQGHLKTRSHRNVGIRPVAIPACVGPQVRSHCFLFGGTPSRGYPAPLPHPLGSSGQSVS